jgi:DNA repair protein RecO (recombination protein O)
MEATKNTLALVLNRQAYRESDSLVTVYTRDFGRLSLIARGTKKLQSKLAGHLEPLTLLEIMIVGGKGLDYIGSAVTRDAYLNLKNDLNKLYYAGQAINLFRRLVKENQADERLFFLLTNWLEVLDNFIGEGTAPNQTELAKETGELFFAFFAWKLLVELGYQPEMSKCLVCGCKIEPGKNWFNFKDGGLICPNCHSVRTTVADSSEQEYFLVSDNCLKLIRFILGNGFKQAGRLRLDKKIIKEENQLLRSFLEFIK